MHKSFCKTLARILKMYFYARRRLAVVFCSAKIEFNDGKKARADQIKSCLVIGEREYITRLLCMIMAKK